MDWSDWDKSLLALTLWREARGEGHEGMRAVAHVIRNRVSANANWSHVMSAKWQFSSLTAKGDPQLALWPTQPDAAFEDAMSISELVYSGQDEDPTGGATHYFADTILPPPWAKAFTFTVQIGHHRFYK